MKNKNFLRCAIFLSSLSTITALLSIDCINNNLSYKKQYMKGINRNVSSNWINDINTNFSNSIQVNATDIINGDEGTVTGKLNIILSTSAPWTYTIDSIVTDSDFKAANPKFKDYDDTNGTTYKLIKISHIAFKECKTITGKISFPNSLEVIQGTTLQQGGAFYKCINLKSIDFSECTHLRVIGVNDFSSCIGLTSIDLSNCTSLTTISNCFKSLTNLKSIIFPNSLTTIASDTFLYCSYIKSITFNWSSEQLKKSLDFTKIASDWLTKSDVRDRSAVNVYVPAEAIDTYKSSEIQTKLDITNCNIIGKGSINASSWIGGKEVSGSINLEINNGLLVVLLLKNLKVTDPIINSKVTIGDEDYPITEIKNTYFSGNTNLSGTLTIDSGITSIETNSFDGCNNINSIKLLWNLDEPLPTLNDNWLGSLDDKTKDIIVVPKKIIKYKVNKSNLKIVNCNICSLIEASSLIKDAKGNIKFTDDGNEGSPILNIQSIVLFESITDPIIDSISFNNETGYKLNTIQENLFNNNDKLQGKLTIESSITTIEANAFSNCQNITSLNLASSIISLGKNIFDQTSINKIYLNWNEDQLKEIFASSSNEGSIDPNWLGNLNNENVKVIVPKGLVDVYKSYATQLDIDTCVITDIDKSSNNLPLIIGLSAAGGALLLTGGIGVTVMAVKKHKKPNKKSVSRSRSKKK